MTTPQAKPKTPKNLLMNHEVFVLIAILLAALAVTSSIFFLLWSFFKVGFIWLVCFLLFFSIRRTRLWQFGFEFHFFMIYVTAYAFGPWFALSLILVTLVAVVKTRPGELVGCIINFVLLSLEAIVVWRISAALGPGISASAFLWSAMIVITTGIILDFLLTLRMFPYNWMKLSFTHVVDIFVQYSLCTVLGLAILQFLLAI